MKYNFYQSTIRKTIQRDIYQRPCFEIKVFWKQYLWVIKKKKIGPFSVQWFQILGLELPMEDEYKIQEEFSRIRKEYKQFGNIYFQFGILNEIFRFDTHPPLSPSFIHDILAIRRWVVDLLKKKFRLRASFVENMPLANVMYEVPNQQDFLDQVPSKSTRKVIRKSIQAGFEFRAITDDEIEKFWEYWTDVADMKQFFTVSKEQYLLLVEYLRKEKKWQLFVTTFEWEIMSGGIYIFDEKIITYLYGFIRRDERNIGGQHYLTYALLQWASNYWYQLINAMGVAPIGIKDHPLASVGRVKELIWWYKIEHYWNFDLVFNKVLYRLYKCLRR